jgi:flagellar hook-associated protein 3 FlgL
VLDQLSVDAGAELASLVSALNANTAGRALFAGNATDQPALADASVILNGLRAATAGAATPQDITAAADLWFSDPAGFAAIAYKGSDTDIAPLRLGDGETVSLRMTANDQVFRDMIKQVALATIASDASFALNSEDRSALLSETGRDLLESQGNLTAARANVGSAQARIDVLATRNSTEETALLYAKGALLQADPYEAATELEAVQFQLQSLYAITARMSDLSFVNFIR